MKSSGKKPPRRTLPAILRLAARTATPHNTGRKTREITEKNAPFAPPPRAAAALPANAAAQNHPLLGEKTRNRSRKAPPLFGAVAQKQ